MKRKYITATNVVLGVQIVIFLLMTIMGGSTNVMTLYYFGAKINPLIISGEYYRLIMPIFLHIGLEHLAVNSVMLYFLGNEIESILGWSRFLLIYIGSGVLGNLASFAFNTAISAGASTSLFGLLGVIIYLARQHSYIRSFRQLGSTYGAFIVLNILFGFMSGGVDNFGHLGGLLGGYLLSSALSFKQDRVTRLSERLVAIAAYICVAFLLFKIGLR